VPRCQRPYARSLKAYPFKKLNLLRALLLNRISKLKGNGAASRALVERFSPNLRILFRAFFCAVFALALSERGSAAPFGNFSKTEPGSLPIPVPVVYTVIGREPVRIPLKVVGSQLGLVTFLLRASPKYGSVRLLSAQGDGAQVEYTPPLNLALSMDSFSFVAANSKGVSGEAVVQIKIVDRGPKLEVAAQLDFGTVRVGDRKTLTLEVHNAGDLPTVGSVNVTPPWTLINPETSEQLAPRQKRTLSVQLTPILAGKAVGELRFEGDPSKTVTLTAEVRDWIQAGPDPLKLRAIESQTRMGNLQLSNENDDTQTVTLTSTPPLEHPAEVRLAPHQQIAIPLRSTTRISGSYSGVLTLSGGGEHETKVLLWEAAALGPSLGGVDMNQVPLRLSQMPSDPAPSVLLRNEGGQAGSWALQCPVGCSLRVGNAPSKAQADLQLAPGESARVSLFLTAQPAPVTLGPLKIRGPDGEHVLALEVAPLPRLIPLESSVPIAAVDVAPPASSSAATSFASDVAPQQSLIASVSATRSQIPELDPATIHTMTQAFAQGALLNGLTVTRVKSDRATLVFPLAAAIAPEQLLVHFRSLERSADGSLRIDWGPRSAIKGRRDATGKVTLTVLSLTPGALNTIRVLGPDRGDGSRVILHQCDIESPKTAPWFTFTSVCFCLAVALGGGWIWLKRRV